MGLRMAAMACQRVTSSVRAICLHAGFSVFNYLDDFIGVEGTRAEANAAFELTGNLLRDLGLVESVSTIASPATSQVVLGVLFDTVSMTISITRDRLLEIEELVREWLRKKSASKSSLQSLIGKLMFVSIGRAVRLSRSYWLSYVC